MGSKLVTAVNGNQVILDPPPPLSSATPEQAKSSSSSNTKQTSTASTNSEVRVHSRQEFQIQHSNKKQLFPLIFHVEKLIFSIWLTYFQTPIVIRYLPAK